MDAKVHPFGRSTSNNLVSPPNLIDRLFSKILGISVFTEESASFQEAFRKQFCYKLFSVFLLIPIAWTLKNEYFLNNWVQSTRSTGLPGLAFAGFFAYALGGLVGGVSLLLNRSVDSKPNRINMLISSVLECLFVLGPTVGSGVELLAQSLSRRCILGPTHGQWFGTLCNSHDDSHALPMDNIMVALLTPLLFFTACRSPHVALFVVAWLLGLGFIIAAMVLSNSYSSFSVILYQVALGFLGVYVALIERFMFHQTAHSTSKHKRVVDKFEQQAAILSSMISNLSHDLQSPLQGLEMGMDTLQKILIVESTLQASIKPTHSGSDKSKSPHLGKFNKGEAAPGSVTVMERQQTASVRFDRSFTAESTCTQSNERRDSYGELDPVKVVNAWITRSESGKSMAFDDKVKSFQKAPDVRRKDVIPEEQPGSSRQKESDEVKVNPALDLTQSMQGTITFMSMIISRCLDASRASSDVELVPNRESFDLRESVVKAVRCITDMQSSLPVIITAFPSANCRVYTDKRWFEGNLLCVLSNAVKYSQHDYGIPVEVSISIESVTNLRVEVTDSGVPVGESRRSQFFCAPLVDDRIQMGGSGLGLYTLSKRVEALGGTFGSRRREDGRCSGSVIWFSIPFKRLRSYPSHSFLPAQAKSVVGFGTGKKELSGLRDESKIKDEGVIDQFDGLNNANFQLSAMNLMRLDDMQSDLDENPLTGLKLNAKKNRVEEECSSLFESQNSVGGEDDDIGARDEMVGDTGASRVFDSFRGDSLARSNKSVVPALGAMVAVPGDLVRDDSRSRSKTFVSSVETASVQSFRSPRAAPLTASTPEGLADIQIQNVSSKQIRVEDRTLSPAPSINMLASSTVFVSDGAIRGLQLQALSVLVVDDSLSIRKIMGMSLDRAGHTVQFACDGQQALQAMKETFFDVVLMDFQMPVMGGVECVTCFREYESDMLFSVVGPGCRRNRMLIIGMTASGDVAARAQAIACGMNAFIPKPFSIEAMIAIVKEHMLDQEGGI